MGVVPFRSEAVVETIAVYLVEDRSMPRVACDPGHVNTLRYRFKELTGCSLASTETIMERSFALGVTAREI